MDAALAALAGLYADGGEGGPPNPASRLALDPDGGRGRGMRPPPPALAFPARNKGNRRGPPTPQAASGKGYVAALETGELRVEGTCAPPVARARRPRARDNGESPSKLILQGARASTRRARDGIVGPGDLGRLRSALAE